MEFLVVLGLNNFFKSQVKARDAQRKSDLEQLTKALELYYNDKGHYPIDDGNGHLVLPYDENDDGTVDGTDTFKELAWGDKFDDPDNQFSIYMGNLPQDPKGYTYYYQSLHKDRVTGSFSDHTTSGSDFKAEAYKIYGYLENANDSMVVEGGITGTDCDPTTESQVCNFHVSSGNVSLN